MACLVAMKANQWSVRAVSTQMSSLITSETTRTRCSTCPAVWLVVLATTAPNLWASRLQIRNLGHFSWPRDVFIYSGLLFVQSSNLISRSRALEIMPSKVLRLNMHTNSHMSSSSMTWYFVLFISSVEYCATSSALSQNLAVISAYNVPMMRYF